MRVEVEIHNITVDAATVRAEPRAVRAALADAIAAHMRHAGVPETLGGNRGDPLSRAGAGIDAIGAQIAAQIVERMPR